MSKIAKLELDHTSKLHCLKLNKNYLKIAWKKKILNKMTKTQEN